MSFNEQCALSADKPDLRCGLFDALVRPIPSHGCVEGFVSGGGKSAIEQLEAVHRTCSKRAFEVPTSTPNMVYAQFGRILFFKPLW